MSRFRMLPSPGASDRAQLESFPLDRLHFLDVAPPSACVYGESHCTAPNVSGSCVRIPHPIVQPTVNTQLGSMFLPPTSLAHRLR